MLLLSTSQDLPRHSIRAGALALHTSLSLAIFALILRIDCGLFADTVLRSDPRGTARVELF